MRMRNLLLAAIAAGALAGCEHKKPVNKGTDPASKAKAGEVKPPPTPVGGLTPEAVPKEVPPAPPGAEEVRPPVAEDLAGYVKDIAGSGPLKATFQTNQGTINCQLFEDKTPMTVANFVGLATGKKAWKNPRTGAVEKGVPFYDGLTFHRVIPDFMIQGGDPLGRGSGDPGYEFGDEIVPDLKHDKPGRLSMANAGPGTNGSQFFLTERPTPHLDGRHTVFGTCNEIDIIKKIARVPTGANDRPAEPVIMQKVTISRGKI